MTFGIDDILAEGLKLANKYIQDPAEQAQLALEIEKLDIRREEIAINDKDSARKREMEVKDNTPRQLAFIVTALYATLQISLLFIVIPDGNRDLLMRALGVLDACLIGVWGYYFGSSSEGAKKNITIADLVKRQ